MLANLCQHGNFFFLSWHRMYLYYFERVIRCVSGQPTFSLPFWGYSPTGSRDLPKPFRSPADPSNVLYVASRDPDVNAGVPLSGPTVDPGVALAEIAYNSFSSMLEGTPHNVVHVAVGGLMGFVSSAAQDPIFWLHHAAIDRLWNVWLAQGGGRSNPTDPTWLNTNWEFYDENGTVVKLSGAQVVDTAMQLGYRYAPLPCASITTASETQVYQPDASARAVQDPIRSRPPLSGAVDVGVQGAVTLGAEPVQVTVPVSADGQRALQSFAGDPKGGSALVVVLDDISLLQPARVFYEVYADLPAAAGDTAYGSPHYVGNLDFFGISEPMGGMAMPRSRRLSLLRVYAYLRSRGLWSDKELRLTFVPRGHTEGGQSPAARLGGAAQAVIGRVSLRVE
jgi:tyrosinase